MLSPAPQETASRFHLSGNHRVRQCGSATVTRCAGQADGALGSFSGSQFHLQMQGTGFSDLPASFQCLPMATETSKCVCQDTLCQEWYQVTALCALVRFSRSSCQGVPVPPPRLPGQPWLLRAQYIRPH